MTKTLPNYVLERIRERNLQNAADDLRVTVELTDRNGQHVSTCELTAKGYSQQEEILQMLELQGFLSPMAEYYFLNWPKSLLPLLCELKDVPDSSRDEAEAGNVGPQRRVALRLQEAQLCCCPE